VVLGVTLGGAERGVPVGRDRRGRGHREPPAEVAGRLGDRHLEGVVVDGPDAGDLVGVAGPEVVEALDRRVVEAVPAGAGLGVGLTLDRTHEVARGDLDVLERRGVRDPCFSGNVQVRSSSLTVGRSAAMSGRSSAPPSSTGLSFVAYSVRVRQHFKFSKESWEYSWPGRGPRSTVPWRPQSAPSPHHVGYRLRPPSATRPVRLLLHRRHMPRRRCPGPPGRRSTARIPSCASSQESTDAPTGRPGGSTTRIWTERSSGVARRQDGRTEPQASTERPAGFTARSCARARLLVPRGCAPSPARGPGFEPGPLGPSHEGRATLLGARRGSPRSPLRETRRW